MNHPMPWLKYADAGDIDNDVVDFDKMNVESPGGEHLGVADGFILDADTGRPYYVVVDSGGWFKSKHFLLPVGHVRLDQDDDGGALVTSLTRDRIDRFPGFDRKLFEKMSDSDLKRFNDETCAACTIEGVVVTYNSAEPLTAAWNRSDFRYPDWWSAEPTRPDRMGATAVTKGAEYHSESKSGAASREQVTAKADDLSDVSPHFDGRAQPGDVIGIETGGERTEIGDTSDDENKRRQAAQKNASKQS